MKYTALCLLLSLLQNFVAAQPTFSDFPVVQIGLDPKPQPEPSYQLIFNHILVLDQRPDTTRIGFHASGSLFEGKARQIIFPSTTATTITNWLNKNYTRPDAPYDALIVLRNLWLSDANVRREDIIKYPELNDAQTCIRVKAEVYAAQNGQFIPLFRMDTLQVSLRAGYGYQVQAPYYDWEKDLSGIFIELVERSATTIPLKQGTNQLLDRQKIDSFNRFRFIHPIDTAASLNPGVYASFEEFINNAPSIHQYQIQTEKKEQLLYIQDATGKLYYSHDSWGYCDGNTIFVMKSGKLCPAWRVKQALYFLDTSEKLVAPLINPYGADRQKHTNKNKHSLFTVDMDNGNTY